jgi:hypothetical protein
MFIVCILLVIILLFSLVVDRTSAWVVRATYYLMPVRRPCALDEGACHHILFEEIVQLLVLLSFK